MGLCVSQIKQKQKLGISSKQEARPHPTRRFGIERQLQDLKFNHAPLSNSQFLLEKFYYDSRRPEEVNLLWQVLDTELLGQTLNVQILALKNVNVWVAVGGAACRNISGLLMGIKGVRQSQGSSAEGRASEPVQTICKFQLKQKVENKSLLYVILESQDNTEMSLFLIQTYHLTNRKLSLLSQELQWNSLSFSLTNIYGQGKQGRICDQAKCIICQDADPNCIFLPCRHLCIGMECVEEYRSSSTRCPLCKEQIDEIVVYRRVQPI